MSSDDESEEEENEDDLPDESESALKPMMLINSHLDGDAGDHNDGDSDDNEKDKDNNITNESEIVGEKNKNVSFYFAVHLWKAQMMVI